MRKQTADHKRRKLKLQLQSEKRHRVVSLLKEGTTIRRASAQTGVNRGTVQRIKNHMTPGQENELQRLIGTQIFAGRQSVIRESEATLINNRLKLAAQRGFAVDIDSFRHILSRIAADGRQGYSNQLPSDEAIRTYRAHNRDISYKKIENKESAKLAAESYEHVESFFKILDDIQTKHHGILQDPRRVWNMDETAVDCTLGKWLRGFTSATTKNGGHRSVKSTYGMSKHITAVIAANATGILTPPFFIVAGKRKNSDWWSPVISSSKITPHGIIERFTKANWFPLNGCIKVSENGSMEGPLLSCFVQHLFHTASQVVSDNQSILLFLDGHSSRKNPDWVSYCSTTRMEAVVNAANTSHILQPCDQYINKRFQENMRLIRDEFCRQGNFDTTKVNFNIACAVYAWEQITPDVVQNSFKVTGTFPFQRSFPQKFKKYKDEQNTRVKAEEERLNDIGIASRFPSVRRRQSDQEVFKKLLGISESSKSISKKLQDIQILLKREETVNSILMQHTCRSSLPNTEQITSQNRVLSDAGAPAEWITHGDEMKRRETVAAQKKAEQENQIVKKKMKEIAALEKRVQKEAEQLQRSKELQKRSRDRMLQAKVKQNEKAMKTEWKRIGAFLLEKKPNMECNDGNMRRVTKKERQLSLRSYQFIASLVVTAADEAVQHLFIVE